MAGASRYVLVALVAFCVALAASWLSRSILTPNRTDGGELHALMYEKLDLEAGQKARIDALEAAFASRRNALDAQLRQSNAELAAAIATEHGYGPRVASAVDRSHIAMGALQKATLQHVFAMRAVLRPDQAATFDAEIGKALTEPAPR